MFTCKNLFLIFLLILTACIVSCKNKYAAVEKQIIEDPAKMDDKVNENIKAVLQYAIDNNGKINDSIKLNTTVIIDSFYQKNDYKHIWNKDGVWQPLADSLYNFIEASETYGLFPSDYHFKDLKILKLKIAGDSLARKDANVWTKAELMLSDAFMQIAKHLKQGRLLPDSISLSADTSMLNNFFIKNLNAVVDHNSLSAFFNSLEPKHTAYIELKKGIKKFVDSMDREKYTYLVYPNKDSFALIKNLQIRLFQGGYLQTINRHIDSAELANAIKTAQKSKKIKADGKINSTLIKILNNNDAERFKRIAINIDRYKQLPASLPEKYIWVNLPAYYLRVYDNDTLVMESKTIVGKPATRTPKLNSQISNMVTYPKWTIPNSIIKKDIIPGMKRNPGYLAHKGFNLVNEKGETIDPYSINWEKYTTGIPYKVVQGSGDDNALGIFKFNFENPYNVYLHDTNQRYLFKNSVRDLSHGCVRVQDWEKLANFIAVNDSINLKPGTMLSYTTDSIKNWLQTKERKTIIVKNRIQLFIRYFTCEAKKGKLVFYDDIYSEDKILREKYFANK